MEAVDQAFEETNPKKDAVLFYLPVTKAWIAAILRDSHHYEKSVS